MHQFFSFYGCRLDTCYIFHLKKSLYLVSPPPCCPTSLLHFVAESTRSIHASVLYISFLSSCSYLNWLSWGFCFWYAATSLLTGSPRISMMTNPMNDFSVLNLLAFSILPWKTFFILLWGISVSPGSFLTQVATVALSLSGVLPHLLTSKFQNTPRLSSKTSSFLYVSSFPRCFT